MSKTENLGSNAKSWQLHLEWQCKQKQKPQGWGILSKSLPPGVTGGVPSPSREVSRLSVWTHIHVLHVVDWHHNLTTESSAASPAEGTPTFSLDCHSHPPTMAHQPLNYTGTTLWGRAVNPNREPFQLQEDPRNKCMYVFNSQHDLSNYCSGITEGWSGTVWWEQEYLMPVLLTNILDWEIMALGSFLSAASTKLLDF